MEYKKRGRRPRLGVKKGNRHEQTKPGEKAKPTCLYF
jgi:hypothetical protein